MIYYTYFINIFKAIKQSVQRQNPAKLQIFYDSA